MLQVSLNFFAFDRKSESSESKSESSESKSESEVSQVSQNAD